MYYDRTEIQLLIAESKGKMAHDFCVFFMGHKNTMKSRYTTNKGVLPEVLMAKMYSAFTLHKEHLGRPGTDDTIQQRLRVRQLIQDATPQQLGHIY